MTIRNLDFLFRPKSVAVIVEKEHPGQYEDIVLRNLQEGGFDGPVMRVTARKRSRFKIGPRVRLAKMEVIPELAIICTRLEIVAEIIAQLGEQGTRAVIVAPSIRERLPASEAAETRKAILQAARPYALRVLGSRSGGLLVPSIGLNASVSPIAILPGRIALITQSTAIASAIVDQATSKGIGFSSVVHLGEGLDVDLADALDWFATDSDTDRILVQFDTLEGGRKFMSAARACGRNKPIVAIRNKRSASARPAYLPFDPDEVYDAALSRSGWVQVATLGEAFEAAQAMARLKPMVGDRLTILANGNGLGGIAADVLRAGGGKLAILEPETLQQLAVLLRTEMPLGNPLALPASVCAADWAKVLKQVLADPNTHALMTVYSPSPFASSSDVATEVGLAAQTATQNIFSCWVGGDSMKAAQQIADAFGLLSHTSPEQAVAVFVGLVKFYHNRELLRQMPPSMPEGYSIDLDTARAAVAEGLEARTRLLSPRLSRKLLQAFGIEVVEYSLAGSAEAAIEVANQLGYPVDLGLVLANAVPFDTLSKNLQSPAEIHMAIRSLRQKARNQWPGIRLTGYRLRRSMPRSGVAPLRIGVAVDRLFGPVIYLGPSSLSPSRSGRFVVGLPPLNLTLARDMVLRSGLGEEQSGLDGSAAVRATLEANASMALVRLSQLLSDIDEVVDIDLDPLHVETAGVLALQARVWIEGRTRRLGSQRFAISPYPKELERQIKWGREKLLLRPIRPEDEQLLGQLLETLTPEDSRMRFFVLVRGQTHLQLARFSQIDYDREMSLVVIRKPGRPDQQVLAEARLSADADNEQADFAIVVSSLCSGRGLGRMLLQQLIEYARVRGIARLHGETLIENKRMQQLAESLGFQTQRGADPATLNLYLTLRETANPA